MRVRLLDHPAAAAYCLPGVRPRIVLSRGVLDALSRAELTADNAVARAGQRAALETALRRLAVPAQAHGHRQAADRARLLAGPPRPLSRLAAPAVCAAAVALVLVPPAILIVS